MKCYKCGNEVVVEKSIDIIKGLKELVNHHIEGVPPNENDLSKDLTSSISIEIFDKIISGAKMYEVIENIRKRYYEK